RAAVAAGLLPTAGGGAGLGGALIATDLGGPHVACAADADRLLLHDPDGGGLHLVDPSDPGVTLTPVATVDPGRRAATVARGPTAATRLTPDPPPAPPAPAPAPAAADRARYRAAWPPAAVLVGLGQTMLDLAVAYVTERHQFGVPVGSFQAVKHHLADAHKDLAFARPAVHRAAHSLATGADTT